MERPDRGPRRGDEGNVQCFARRPLNERERTELRIFTARGLLDAERLEHDSIESRARG
jgi:hypothetical protein